MSVYVSIDIRGGIDDLWEKTQNPKQHERWDLRFTEIDFLDAKRFRYATRLGFGVRVEGEAESVTSRKTDGCRLSSLRFWSDQRHSLIREGSGYWKYRQLGETTSFQTGYDYQTRFGRVGKAFDRLCFRPVMAWATAWSFDRLRIWMEKGIPPETSRDKAVIHAVCRVAIALVWLWHGLVSKLITHDPVEAVPFLTLGVSPALASLLVQWSGVLEMALGFITLVIWKCRRLFLIEGAAFLALGIGGVATTPGSWGAAFSPVSLTLCLVTLCVAGYLASRDLPAARHARFSWRGKL